MNQEKLRERVHAGIDRHCAPLTADPYRVQRVLNAASKEGGVVVKRKVSIVFVLVMILILSGTVALAAIGLGQLYEHVIQKEGQAGIIKDWSAEDKIALIDMMLEAGVELDQTQIEKLHHSELTEEEQDAMAWSIISSYYPARDSILTSVDIIAKEKGPIEKWSLEDRAWLSDMIDQYQPEDRGRNLIPTDRDICQADVEQMSSEIMVYFKR